MSKPIRFAEPPLNTKSVLTNCLTSRKVISKSKGLVNAQKHLYLDTRTAKSMNRFLYEIATTACVLKHVLFVIDNKVRTIHGENFIYWNLSYVGNKVKMLNENVEKGSQNTQVLVNISQRLEVRFGLIRMMFTLPKLWQKEFAAKLDRNLAAKMKRCKSCY